MLAGSRRGERFGNGERGAVGRKRAVAIALREQHVADPVMADREVALPFGVGGIAAGERFGNGERGTVGRKRAVAIALREQHVADPVMADREVALVAGATRCLLCTAICLGRVIQVAGYSPQIAEMDVSPYVVAG